MWTWPHPFQTLNRMSRFYSLTDLFNSSLASGIFPQCFKSALVTPILKKRCLDHNDLNNYRPVSNLCFNAKILEKLVLSQVSSYLNSHNLYNTCQSAYRPGHSTETALLKVVNDLFLSLNKGNISVVVVVSFIKHQNRAITSLAWLFFSIWYNWSYYPCTPSTYWLWIYWYCPSMVFILSDWSYTLRLSM